MRDMYEDSASQSQVLPSWHQFKEVREINLKLLQINVSKLSFNVIFMVIY